MSSKNKINQLIVFILSIISFCSLVYILLRVNMNVVEAININQKSLDFFDIITIAGYLFITIFHLYGIIFIFTQFRYPSEFKWLRILILIIGISSLLALGVEKVMIDEIAKEYRSGFIDQGEFNILNYALTLNLLFNMMMIYYLLKLFRRTDKEEAKNNFADENIFLIAQYLGILAGLLGIFQTFVLISSASHITKFWIFIPFYVLFLMPYGLSVVFWLSLKLKKNISEWYDDKQFQDILKSSLTTLILSIPCLLVMIPFNILNPIYWFMYYVFLVLLLFSGCILFYFKIQDAV
ncbi:MAG: hypothetical protein JW956_10905 [Calditrichaceae bacterium]|nr:hypothetical protein [Calditrichaceae bacterium]